MPLLRAQDLAPIITRRWGYPYKPPSVRVKPRSPDEEYEGWNNDLGDPAEEDYGWTPDTSYASRQDLTREIVDRYEQESIFLPGGEYYEPPGGPAPVEEMGRRVPQSNYFYTTKDILPPGNDYDRLTYLSIIQQRRADVNAEAERAELNRLAERQQRVYTQAMELQLSREHASPTNRSQFMSPSTWAGSTDYRRPRIAAIGTGVRGGIEYEETRTPGEPEDWSQYFQAPKRRPGR